MGGGLPGVVEAMVESHGAHGGPGYGGGTPGGLSEMVGMEPGGSGVPGGGGHGRWWASWWRSTAVLTEVVLVAMVEGKAVGRFGVCREELVGPPGKPPGGPRPQRQSAAFRCAVSALGSIALSNSCCQVGHGNDPEDVPTPKLV